MIVIHRVSFNSSVCLQAPESRASSWLLDKELSVWLRNNLSDLHNNKNAENNNKMERNLLQ